MEEATYLAVGLIVLEILWRIYECPNITFEYIQTTGFEPFLWWIVAYLLCIGMVLLEVKNLPFFQSKFVRNSIKILHALDGLIALVVGMAFYYENNTLLAIGILCITKFFLLHLLSRMVTGVKAFSKWSVIVQTTKTFIHHTASFYFLAAGLSVERLSNTILLTALWRSISMTGHAVLALRAQTADDGWEGFTLTEKTYDRWTWNISHLRNAMIVVVLVSCYYDHHIRRGFALSAAGHVAYMVVRAIPVFRIASQYFPNPQEREQWENLTDAERLKKLRQGENPWLALELSLMFICSIVLLYLRATMTLIVDYDTCTFA